MRGVSFGASERSHVRFGARWSDVRYARSDRCSRSADTRARSRDADDAAGKQDEHHRVGARAAWPVDRTRDCRPFKMIRWDPSGGRANNSRHPDANRMLALK